MATFFGFVVPGVPSPANSEKYKPVAGLNIERLNKTDSILSSLI